MSDKIGWTVPSVMAVCPECGTPGVRRVGVTLHDDNTSTGGHLECLACGLGRTLGGTMNQTVQRCYRALSMLDADGDMCHWSDQHTAALREAVSVFAADQTEAERIRAECEQLRADARWLPIETAPRDGTWVVCWAPGWRHPVFLTWKTNPRITAAHEAKQDLSLAASYFGDPDEWDDYDMAEPGNGPTHWKPLPPTPIDAARSKEQA